MMLEGSVSGRPTSSGSRSRRLVNGDRDLEAPCRPLEGGLVQLGGPAQPVLSSSPALLALDQKPFGETGLTLVYVGGGPQVPSSLTSSFPAGLSTELLSQGAL